MDKIFDNLAYAIDEFEGIVNGDPVLYDEFIHPEYGDYQPDRKQIEDELDEKGFYTLDYHGPTITKYDDVQCGTIRFRVQV